MARADRLVLAAGAATIVGTGALAVETRRRLVQSRRRFGLLAALAEIGEGTTTLEDTVEAVQSILVPAFGDVATIDVVRDEVVRRVGVRAAGPRAAEIEAWLRERPLTAPRLAIAPNTRRLGRTQLATDLSDAELGRLAVDGEDLAHLEALGPRSVLSIPLITRGRTLGTLSLMVTALSGRRFQLEDVPFAEVMSGRVALALDNAGLFAELETMEAQLSAALGSLSDAVTVQTPQGTLLYANDAAARSMGFASSAELLGTPPSQIVSRYDSFTEDGAPLDVADLPGRRVLAGEDPEPLLIRTIERETGEESFKLVKASAVRDRRGNPRLAVNVIEDVTEAKLAERAQDLLVRASEALASSLDYEQTLQQVAELAVPELGDWCGVNLPDRRHGVFEQVAVAHRDPDKVRLAWELSDRYPSRVDEDSGTAEVLRTGRSQTINAISDEMLRAGTSDAEHYEIVRGLGMRAAMLVPLMVGGRAIGVLVIASAESGKTFTAADVALAEELGRRAGTAVENARLYTERSSIATTLQEGLLPRPLPDMPGWATAAWYRPAGAENSVGGDFYDAFEVATGWMVVVGDVAGRGALAAATTAVARHTLRTAAQLLASPLDAVGRLNRELLQRGGGALCTLGVALLRDSEATVICAGHPPAIHVHGGAVEAIGRFGPMLGAIEDATWEPVTVTLGEGDTLVLYTDGVIDTEGRPGRFGEERLQAVLAGAAGPGDAVARIEAAVLEFEHGEQADDTAVVAVGRVR